MRTNKLLFGLLAIVAIALTSCSAASVASGTYNGTFSTYSNSGSTSANYEIVNDNTVKITITADGDTYVFDNVALTKTEVLGVVLVEGTMSNSDMTLSTSVYKVQGIRTVDLNMDSTSSSAYLSFDATL